MNDQLIISDKKFRLTKKYYIQKEGGNWKLLIPFEDNDGPYFIYTKDDNEVYISGKAISYNTLEDMIAAVNNSYVADQHPRYIDDMNIVYYQDEDELSFGNEILTNDSASFVYILCQQILKRVVLMGKDIRIGYEDLLTNDTEMIQFDEFRALRFISELDPAITARYIPEGCYIEISYSRLRSFLSIMLPSIFG